MIETADPFSPEYNHLKMLKPIKKFSYSKSMKLVGIKFEDIHTV